MRKRTQIPLILGILLILLAVLAVFGTQVFQKQAAEKADVLYTQLLALMPEVQDTAPDGRTDPAMPLLEVEGTDFAGVMELPAYGTTLPLCAHWNPAAVARYPCRYTGSLYDNSLIIGGSDAPGQLDFTKTVTNGDTVYVTDTTGGRYRFTVTAIEKTKDVSAENLSRDADLTLFARNTYNLDYTVIRCSLK